MIQNVGLLSILVFFVFFIKGIISIFRKKKFMKDFIVAAVALALVCAMLEASIEEDEARMEGAVVEEAADPLDTLEQVDEAEQELAELEEAFEQDSADADGVPYYEEENSESTVQTSEAASYPDTDFSTADGEDWVQYTYEQKYSMVAQTIDTFESGGSYSILAEPEWFIDALDAFYGDGTTVEDQSVSSEKVSDIMLMSGMAGDVFVE